MTDNYLLAGVGLLKNIALSKNKAFMNNDRIVIDNRLYELCSFFKGQFTDYIGRYVFTSDNALPIAVGMAICENNLSNRFNKFDLNIIDHHIYCIVENLANGENFEAINLAVKSNLNKLVIIYSNTDERLLYYYRRLGVNVVDSESELDSVLHIANTPIMVSVDILLTRINKDDYTNECKKMIHSSVINGASRERTFKSNLARFKKNYHDEYKLLEGFFKDKPSLTLDVVDAIAGVDLGNYVLNKLVSQHINFVGGTPDKIIDTRAYVVGGDQYPDNPIGNNINFAGFERVMHHVCAGMSMHKGLFVFSADLMSNAYRLFDVKDKYCGLIILIEDQLDYLSLLRLQQHFYVFRPCNASEVAFAYEYAYNNDGPTIVILSKELLCSHTSTKEQISNGAYVLHPSKDENGVIIASGIDICRAIEVKNILSMKGLDITIVSLPCVQLFEQVNFKFFQRFKKIKSVMAFDGVDNSVYYKYLPRTGTVFNTQKYDVNELAKKVFDVIKRNGERMDSLFE